MAFLLLGDIWPFGRMEFMIWCSSCNLDVGFERILLWNCRPLRINFDDCPKCTHVALVQYGMLIRDAALALAANIWGPCSTM